MSKPVPRFAGCAARLDHAQRLPVHAHVHGDAGLRRLLLVVLTLALPSCVHPSGAEEEAATAAPREKYEFVGGETLCTDPERVLKEFLSLLPGRGNRLTSLRLRVGTTEIWLAPDRWLDEQYFVDLADFIESHPDDVKTIARGSLYEVDVIFRPAAEVGSTRLRDLLAPGNGSRSIVVAKPVRELRETSRASDARLADIFLAMCGSDPAAEPRCERAFPFMGFRARYELPSRWEDDVPQDQELRAELAEVVSPCR